MRHLSTETILDQLEGRSQAGGSDVAAHLASCERCRQAEAELRELLTFFAADVANEPGADALRWAVDLMQPALRR